MNRDYCDLILPFKCAKEAPDGYHYQCVFASPCIGELTHLTFYYGSLVGFSIGEQSVLLQNSKHIYLPSPLTFSYPVHPSNPIRILTTHPTKGYFTLRMKLATFR